MQSEKYTIENEYLAIEVSALGAEMQSIKGADGVEYLWQGDPEYWPDRAINLFPYIGRMTKGVYKLHEKNYPMDIHGFVKTSQMSVDDVKSHEITFALKDSHEIRKVYPYTFEYRVNYRLIENNILVTYEVENRDYKTMFFGLGGHPGFNVPLRDGLDFSDYYLEFGERHTPVRVGMSETCFVTGNDRPFELLNERRIELTHDLFNNDAIILVNMCKSITLKTDKDNKSVTMKYPQMDYLGMWHVPNSDAPYICLEPWSSLPSRQGVIEDFELQPGLVNLNAGEVYRNTWSITIC